MGAERDYVLGTHEEELARLGLQHRVWRPVALDCWQRAGITVGKRVLDVGAGPGYAAIDLAEIVGPKGEVVALERQRLMWILERRLRVSTLYWRITSKSRAEMVIRAGAGGVACVLFGLAGIAVAPLGLHRAIRLWCRAMGGLGRVVAVSRLRWRGY